MDLIAFKVMMFRRVQIAGLSVTDIIVDCGMILLFFCAGYCGDRLAAMLIFGSCITFVLLLTCHHLPRYLLMQFLDG